MKKYLILVVALLALAVAAFFVGCSDNKSTDPGSRSVTVSAPATAVSWTVGSTHTIRWSTYNVDSVDVFLLINGSSVGQLNTANNNRALTSDSLSWTVTDHASTSASIKVAAHSDAATYGTSGIFTIAAQPVLVSPWEANPASLQMLEVDTLRLWLRLDSTYVTRERAGSYLSVELGTYSNTADSIRFHATTRNNQTINETYTRWYHVNTQSDNNRDNDLLSIHIVGYGSQGQDSLYTVVATRF